KWILSDGQAAGNLSAKDWSLGTIQLAMPKEARSPAESPGSSHQTFAMTGTLPSADGHFEPKLGPRPTRRRARWGGLCDQKESPEEVSAPGLPHSSAHVANECRFAAI